MAESFVVRSEQWSGADGEIVSALTDAFVRRAIDNRGRLTSPRRAGEVVSPLVSLLEGVMSETAVADDIIHLASSLAEQGLSVESGVALMQALSQSQWAQSLDTSSFQKLNQFQITFLGALSEARERITLRSQENTQRALHDALQNQLKQQSLLREIQEERSATLNKILQLSAQLARIKDESVLLDEAVSGICRSLDLANVTIFERHAPDNHWAIRTTTADFLQPGHDIPARMLAQLNEAMSAGGELLTLNEETQTLSVTLILNVGKKVIGGIIANSNSSSPEYLQDLPVWLRTFAQNLAALWRNISLLTEAANRAKELEILYGRYLDTIWGDESAVLHARYDQNRLTLDRNISSPAPATTETKHSFPLQIGEHTFGQLKLPSNVTLSDRQKETLEAILREMSSALNNTQLVQTTRAYSNQLSLAAEVSRAATTQLDRQKLIEEVVELIRARFNYYYVGLFLVDDSGEKAVLQAGTGEAGRIQVERQHSHTVGGKSMVGTAVATGIAQVEQDVREATNFSPNPLLPDTRAELALPLRTRNHIIGALTVQSTQVGAFSRQTVTVLQTLADQLAVAIENATLFDRLQDNLEATNALYEAGRRIGAAKTAQDVYQALVDFAAHSETADIAHIITADPNAPDFLISPALWSRQPVPYNPQQRYLRDRFVFSEHLQENRLIILRESDTKTGVDPYTRKLMKQYDVRTTALIPIHTENEWLGTLALHWTNALPITPNTLQPYRTLADQAAITLSNQRLLQQAELLYEIGRALSQALTREEALNIAVEGVSSYTAVSQCRIVLYDSQIGQGQIVAEHIPTSLVDTVSFPMLGDYVYEQLNQNPAPLLLEITDTRLPAEARRLYLQQFGVETSLLIPAFSQQELIGFMALDSQHGKRPFTPNNIIFAQTVMDHLTTQLENLKLLDEALRRAQELITLNQVQSSLTGIIDLDLLAQTTYNQIGRLLDNTCFSLALYNADTHEFTPILTIQEGMTIESPPITLTPDHPIYQFLHTGEPLLTDKNHPLMQNTPFDIGIEKPQSAVWIPLTREGKPSGLLTLQAYDQHVYNENHLQLLRSIATQTSLAIENARLFRQIQHQLDELQALDKLKTQFLANMSHELRTPLNSIIGFSKVMLKGIDGPLTKEQEEDLTTIYQNGQHLLMLINEILDMAKIEAGKMTLTFESVDLEEAARTVLATTRTLIKERVVLTWDIPPDLPPIEADGTRIRQILLNLLSNAAKYTNEGSIHLRIEQPNENLVHITVSDTGIGIAPEDYDKVFAAFEQVDNSTTRTVGGTGLGMPITKWLVESHNGRIWFESQVGHGTTFHIALPIKQTQKTAELSLNQSSNSGTKTT